MRLRTALFLVVLAFAAASMPTPAAGQRAGKAFRVGLLTAPSLPPSAWEPFRARLAESGYTEGKNLVIEQRSGEGRYDRLPAVATELVDLGVDVIFTVGTRAARLVSEAVKNTPLVIYSCDPFEHVARLARPTGNLTGVTCMTTELSPKRLELLKELVPQATRVAFLYDPSDAPMGLTLTQEIAPRLGVTVRVAPSRSREELPGALERTAKDRVHALYVFPDPLLFAERRQIAEFALAHRLPTMYAFREFVDAGGLMSYGASDPGMLAMGAEQVAKILGGARPGDVPVRQATRFELTINLKTAKALGLTVPPSLLLRADHVIE